MSRVECKSPGHAAYILDVSRCPLYPCGKSRVTWDKLPKFVQASWEKNPTPREFKRSNV